jgi:predicted double-glycine peptidase
MVVAVPATAGPVRSLLEERRQGVVVQQWDNSCGAAALATVLTYDLGHPITEERVARGMLHHTDPLKVRHRGGFSLLDMKRFVEELGYEGTGYQGLDLADAVARGTAIVPVNLWGYDHFVVLRGIQDGKVDLADPGFGNTSMAIDDFMSAWTNRVAFYVTPRR